MTRNTRSGLWLVAAGVAGTLFFLASDVRVGLGRWWVHDSLVDAAAELFPGTMVGVGISLLVLGVGLWLATRRWG